MTRRVQAVSIVDAVVANLRAGILNGTHTPGEPITEAVIAAEYEISRPTARAAIERLTSDGLLERGPHRSARVPKLTPADVRDIYETRLRIESEAVRALAARASVPDAARDASRDVRGTGTASDVASVEPDLRFHTSLVDGLESPRTSRLYRSIVGEVLLCMSQVQSRNLLSVEKIATEHEAIVDAVDEGNEGLALELLRGHLRAASERLSAEMTSEPE